MAENVDQTPEWMLRLENKNKRPHRLAHEIGAGSPCLSCGDACPGLDLHFWRKLCRNCKCKKEEHDVKDDEGYEQFEILLGPEAKKRKIGGVLKLKVPEEVKPASVEPSNKGVAFDWVPPNVSDDVAAEYMRKLPARKMPISGSDGALYRRQQLEKQVPLHDLDASKCHNLTPEETEALTEYLENLKSNVVGQGCVTKVPGLYSESRILMQGPHQLHSTSQVLGRPLASSQSADSIRTLPPIPSLPLGYNSVPRPFQPHTRASNEDDDDDLPPPPLPDSLPPNLDLKTPSAFIPNWSLPQQKLQDGTLSGVGLVGDVVHSVGVPGEQWMSSDPSQAHRQSAPNSLQHGLLGQYPAASGRVILQGGLSSHKLHSENIPGQGAKYTAALASSGATQGLPQNASLSVLHTEKGMSQSSGVPSHSGNYTRPLQAQGGRQIQEPRYGSVPPDGGSAAMLPQDGTTLASLPPKGMAHASAAPGQIAPQYSANLKNKAVMGSRSAKGEVGAWPQDGVLKASTYPQGVAHSSPASGMPSNIGQKGDIGPHPYDGVVMANAYPQGVAHSSSAPGQMIPGMSSAIGQNGVPRVQDGTLSGVKLPHEVAYSSSVPGQKAPVLSASLGDHGAIPQYPAPQLQYVSEAPGEGMVASTLPVDGVLTASLRPQGELASSSAVATDALPKSALVMQQTHPTLGVEDLTGLMEQLSGSDGQEVAAQAHLDCPECNEAICAGEVAVFAERAGNETAWHPQCFVCSTCKELLVDLIYFYHKGKVYCGRHFAELLNIPRCFACDELIFVKEYTVAEGKAFHVRHFCCYECDDPLAGKQYVPVDNQPVCLDCFDLRYGKKCHTCKQKIAAGDQRVGWKELNWHVKGDCFRCFECAKSLLGGRFVVKENQPFCSKECVQAGLAKLRSIS
ncbi:uncharacterized protein Tes [Anabrus simplex]|uniref:uncharacterized protein Tes n=1 Tax=Anabrus simplex TaxID=316456 RepID=UPI0035A32447